MIDTPTASHRGQGFSSIGKPIEPTGKLVPAEHPWMTSPPVVLIMETLNSDGVAARFVGGCVRDALLKRPIRDIDIATTAPPEDVTRMLQAKGVSVIPTGLAHGTVTAIIDGQHFQITTLRHDKETDGRRATVIFTDDWEADAARRDFTINTLSCTLDGDIYDPFHGIEDLNNGYIRFVGIPLERIDEDALRILRYFRFVAFYGKYPLDKESIVACRARAAALETLSGDRIRQEFLKILECGDPAGMMVLMRGEHVFRYILPEAGDVGRLRMLRWLETDAIKLASVEPDPIRRLAALISTDADGARAVAKRFNLSNADRDRLVGLTEPDWRPGPNTSLVELSKALRSLTPPTVRDLILLEWAGVLAIAPRQKLVEREAWQRMLTTTEEWEPVRFPIRGRDVVDLGVGPGPAITDYLMQVEDWWEAGDYKADRLACLAKLREVVKKAH